MNNRDMYYGYGGFAPIPSSDLSNFNESPNNFTNGIFNDINSRVERLERQIKRLDQRLSRLEVPYSNNNSSIVDNDKYIM